MVVRKFVILTLLFGTILPPLGSAHATAGTKCSASGAQKVVKQVSFVCTRVGKNLVWQKSTTSKSTTTTVATTTTVPALNLDTLKVSMTVGAVRAGTAGSTTGGPWESRAVLRTSTDGVTFSGGETIMDQAGVPNLLSTSDGTIYAYYQDWANGGIMGVAIRKPGSSSWERYKLSVSGINTAPGANGCDPSAVELSDGRIRLFWMQRLGGNRIYSATSSVGAGNGIVFTYDGGFAFETAGQIFDPTIVQTAAGWSMWTTDYTSATYSTSTNGLNFTAQPSNSVFPNTSVFPWSAARLPSGEIRILAQMLGVARGMGLLYRSTNGGVSFSEMGSGLIPNNSGADAAISFNAKTNTWYQLLCQRM